MTTKANFNYRDFSGEVGRVALQFATILGDGSNLAAILTAIDAVGDALEAITLGTVAGRAYTNQTVADAGTFPASQYAQRELGVRVYLTDNVNGKKSSFTIPAPELSILSIAAGSDDVDISDASVMAALVTAIEANVKSVDGNAVTVTRASVIGRNS